MKKIIAIILICITTFSMFSCDLISSNNSRPDLNGYDQNNEEQKEVAIPMYHVYFETNGGTAIKSQTTNVVISAPETTKKDHAFMGWYLDEQLTQSVVFPLEITYDRTIYAKWLKIRDYGQCEDFAIKDWKGNDSIRSFDVTPRLDLDELSKQGYRIKMTVNYTVYYKKTYDAILDIGYAGPPKYEVYWLNSELKGQYFEDIQPSKSKKQKSFDFTNQANVFNNTNWSLTFSTNNIQNTIYFSDVSITYECFK